jgi:tRNA nucleotidyltransferase/poly(A) polymerase
MLLNSIVPRTIREAIQAQRNGRKVWLVGGAIRDHILGRSLFDLDFAVSFGARDLGRHVADRLQAPYFDLDVDRDAGRIVHGRNIDFAVIRGETIEADLLERDFTINALAIDLEDPDHVLDPSKGIQHLRDGTLRATSDHAIRSDPIRAIRGVRLAVEYALSFERTTLDQIKGTQSLLSEISIERLRDELMRVLGHSDPSIALRMMERLQQLSALKIDTEVLKQIEHGQFTAWETTLHIIHNLSRILLVLGIPFREKEAADLTLGKLSGKLGRYRKEFSASLSLPLAADRDTRQSLFLAALFMNTSRHPCEGYEEISSSGKLAQQKAERLRLSKREVDVIRQTIVLQESIVRTEGADRAAYRFARRGGQATMPAVLLNLARVLACDAPSPAQDEWDVELDRARRILDFAFMDYLPPLIRGDRLAQSLEIAPSPILGQLLEDIREAQMLGDISDQESAIRLAARLLDELREKSQ